VEGVSSLQRGLLSNRTLKQLILFHCQLGDEGIRVLANGLVGNVNIEVLDINDNDITPLGLADIT
jgi:hypothetical protein